MVSSELGKMASYFVLFTNLIHYYSHKEIQFCQNLLCSTKTDCDPEILESYKDSEMDCSTFLSLAWLRKGTQFSSIFSFLFLRIASERVHVPSQISPADTWHCSCFIWINLYWLAGNFGAFACNYRFFL